LRDHPQPTLVDLPVRALLAAMGRLPPDPSLPPLYNIRPQHIFDALLLKGIDTEKEIAVLENSTEIVKDPKSHKDVEQADYVMYVIARDDAGSYLSRKLVFSRTDLLPHEQYIYNRQGQLATYAHYENFADYNGNLIHKISASTGLMTIVAGYLSGTAGPGNSAGAGYAGDGGPATAAAEGNARGVTADAAGNVYIADSGNEVVRMVNTAGIISTIAGKYLGTINTTAPFSGDSGPATSANLNTPEDVEVDANGNLFIADQGNSRVRVIYAGGAQVAALIAATGGGVVAMPGNIYKFVVVRANADGSLAGVTSIGDYEFNTTGFLGATKRRRYYSGL